MELQVGEATMSSSSQECQQKLTEGQMTTIATSKAGHTVLVKHIGAGNKSGKVRKTDDKLRKEVDVDDEDQEETTSEHGDESIGSDYNFDYKPPEVEFEDLACELSQSYKLEPEYEGMTPEQEAAEV